MDQATQERPDQAPAATQVESPTGPAWDAARSANAPLSTKKVPLGEELPIFCERCGYCLHGVAQHVCDKCSVRQFHCPECGHHQPINTLRPAAQKLLGRIRAYFLVLSLLFRINFFGWLLFAWVAMGHEWSYAYSRFVRNSSPYVGRYTAEGFGPRELTLEQGIAFSLFALAFGMVGRMLLLRWRRGYIIGLVLSAMVCFAIVLGAMWRKWEWDSSERTAPLPFSADFVICLGITAAALTIGASIVWGIWSALAHIFLPRQTCTALLEWQLTQSNESASFFTRTGRPNSPP